MRLSVLLTVVAAAVLAGCAGAARPPVHDAATSPSSLRLLQFNVREGATGSRGAAAVAAVIEASHADVVTLDEVTVRSIFDRIAKTVGFHAYYVQARDGYNVGILSRYPLRSCSGYTQPPLHHSAYGCDVLFGGKSWWIFGAHLCPRAHSRASGRRRRRSCSLG